MKKFLIMPNGGKWKEQEAPDYMKIEMIYRSIMCWYINKEIAIRDEQTGETAIFNAKLDKAGNLEEITRR